MLATLLIAAHPSAVRAAGEVGQSGSCWHRPTPKTLEETSFVIENSSAYAERRRQTRATNEPAMLALSSGDLKIGYAAGLLVGWTETGRRPEFAVVTAVGKSAVLAPFAFIGTPGPRKIADLINCRSFDTWSSLAHRAADLIDADTLKQIAFKNDTGGQLLVAVPGSAARPESVWDLGAIAASRHPFASQFIRAVLVAAADHVTNLEPGESPLPVGRIVVRNMTFRKAGTGQPFLWPHGVRRPLASIHLIHSAVLFSDESADYFAHRKKAGKADPGAKEIVLFPALDVLIEARRTAAAFRFASVRPQLNMVAGSEFDPAYLKSLFAFAHRQGRMNKDWQSSVPGLSQ